MNTLILFIGLVCVVLGVVLHMSKSGYLYFVVGARAVVLLALALLGCILVANFAHAGTGGPHGEPAPPIIPCASGMSPKQLHAAVENFPRPISWDTGVAICKLLKRPITYHRPKQSLKP